MFANDRCLTVHSGVDLQLSSLKKELNYLRMNYRSEKITLLILYFYTNTITKLTLKTLESVCFEISLCKRLQNFKFLQTGFSICRLYMPADRFCMLY